MLTNFLLEKLEDWCEKEVWHTKEEVEETIEQFLKEKKDETA